MEHLIKLFIYLIGYTPSFFLFYFLFRKININEIFRNNMLLKIITLLFSFSFYMIGMSIVEQFNLITNYYSLFSGLFSAPSIALISFLLVGNTTRK